MAQHLSMPPLPLRERVPTIPPEVEQVVLRALAKDPKARFASVADFSAALEQASQRALAPTAQLASEQSALNPAAATSYDTVAVALNQPVLPTETTPLCRSARGSSRADRLPRLLGTKWSRHHRSMAKALHPQLRSFPLPWSQ